MIPTVRIVKNNHAGYATINESDFDPDRHTLYVSPEDAVEDIEKEIYGDAAEIVLDKPKRGRKPKAVNDELV